MTQPEQTVKFLPSFFLDVVEMNAIYPSGTLPLHISLFPPIKESYGLEHGKALRKAINPLTPFDVAVGEDDTFDDEQGPVPVKHIRDSENRLQNLHSAFVQTLAHMKHDDQYRQSYSPHISLRKNEQLKLDSTVHIAGFSIVQKIGNDPWEVVDKIRLKGSDEATA